VLYNSYINNEKHWKKLQLYSKTSEYKVKYGRLKNIQNE